MATTGETQPRLEREQFLARLKALMGTANRNLRQAQARYKADKAVRPSADDIREGSFVFLRRESRRRTTQSETSSHSWQLGHTEPKVWCYELRTPEWLQTDGCHLPTSAKKLDRQPMLEYSTNVGLCTLI